MSERFEHALMFRALDKLSDRQPVQRGFAVMSLRDKDELCAIARHAGGKGFEPAWTCRAAGASLLQFRGHFPGSFWFSFCGRSDAGEYATGRQREDECDKST